jgi:hypothetical protein
MQSLGQFSIDPSAPNSLGIDDAVLIAAVQGAFYGSSLPSAQIEGLLAAYVPRKEITDVSDVYGTKWWDYRRLTPGHSFYLFAHHYYRAIKVAARKVVSEQRRFPGRAGGTKKNGGLYGGGLMEVGAESLFDREQAHVTGLWKAMLVADAAGIPYPEFCRLACRTALEQLWKRLPQPRQLYSEKLGAHVLYDWHELQKERLFLAKHPMYAEEHYAALPVQDAYREWMIEQIKQQPEPVMGLMDAIYIRKQLPEAVASQHFPAQLVKRARLLAA